MPIPLSNYVDVVSGIGAAANVSTRSYGGLVISVNPLLPTQGEPLAFTSAAAVGSYFGTTSGEYARALFYFGWVSKNITTPQALSFWFWNNDTATGSLIFGAQGTYTLSTFTAITSGELDLTLGGFTHTLTGINLGSAGSLTAVATTITAAINAYSAGGAAWTGAVVSYNAGTSQFNLVSGTTGADTVAVTAAPSNDLAGPLGWLTGAILSNGTAAQTLTANLNALLNLTNNFGSFCFGPSSINTEANVLAAATWNYATNPNIQFLFSWVVSATNASAWQAAVAGIGGQCGQLASPSASAYPEMEPMMILAATDYTQRNSVQDYMFQQFNDSPSVTTAAAQQTYDALRINYYGQTQTAGQLLSFYQRGVISGGQPVDPSDINVYCNEIWFKDAIGAALMNLLLALAQVPANATGQAQILCTLQGVINQALFNGTISVGKTLSTNQQLYITQVTGSNTAWQQVQNIGYWVNVAIQSYVVDGVTEYKAVYTLIYGKDDTIRLITGSDILI